MNLMKNLEQNVKFIMKIDRFRKCNIKTKIYNVNGAFAF